MIFLRLLLTADQSEVFSSHAKMNILLLGSIVSFVIFLIALFGLDIIIKIIFCVIALILGILVFIYKKYAPIFENEIKSGRENLYEKTDPMQRGFKSLSKSKMTFTLDKRVTGSHIIDESLQEILDFLLRDYVEPWYALLTDDEVFLKSVRDTVQKVAINIANRIKDVDWIPYLTTRLVDDAASHMRLYRQAISKMKQMKSTKGSTSTSSGTPKRSPSHRRNKSETDISWYSQSKFYIPNLKSLNKLKDTNNESNLEEIFFDLEVQMENNLICRDLLCTNDDEELTFLNEISEILLYLLLPKADFDCLNVRYIVRELLVNLLIRPLLNLFSDPDYINQIFIWMCTKDLTLRSDIFLTIIRMTDNFDELIAIKNIVCSEIVHLRSKDSGGDDDLIVKQQLNSLLYVKKILETRIINMQDGLDVNEIDSTHQDWNRLIVPGHKLVNLPLDELLKNNIALSYFIDYMASINQEAYLYFYLNIYGWRVSAEQQLSDIEIQKLKNQSTSNSNSNFNFNFNSNSNSNSYFNNNSNSNSKKKNVNLENLKEAALKIYQQYLSDKASIKLQFDDYLSSNLLTRIKTESVHESWFDDLQLCCYDKLKNEDKFLPSFKRSISYIKLLAELDLLKDSTFEEDIKSLDGISISSANNELDPLDETLEYHQNIKYHSNLSINISNDKDYDINNKNGNNNLSIESNIMNDAKSTKSTDNNGDSTFYLNSDHQIIKLDENTNDENVIRKLQQGRFELNVEIIETGIVNDRGKTYGIYAVAVNKNYESGYNETWHIYRRYSDFHDLHQKIKEKYYDLAKLPFPAKKTFNNTERAVLEQRMLMLNAWLYKLTKPTIADGHMGLQNLLLTFLEQGDYDKGVTGGHISRTIDTLVNPLKTSMKTVTQAVKTMPDNMMNTVDGVMDNISKFFGNHRKSSMFYESVKVGASIDTETDDNIPLRIIILLMDEVFDLKVRNQWLRRRIVTLLRQIIRTIFGDIVNRRIVEYVSLLTSPKNVASYLRVFKQSHWPNGVRAETKSPRDNETKNRTRVAAKIALLSCLSDELKHIIGSETTRRGLLRVFELFQRPILNRRLLYVLLEGIIENLFPHNDLVTIIKKLYSVSPRVKSKKIILN